MLIVYLTIALVLAATIQRSFFLVSVKGYSMYPTYSSGDTILATRIFTSVNENDIVICIHAGEFVIKRVKKIEKNGEIFLMGDNPSNSEDSRTYGPVPISSIYGKVLFYKDPTLSFIRGRLPTTIKRNSEEFYYQKRKINYF